MNLPDPIPTAITPSSNFALILRNMQEAGLVAAVDAARLVCPAWFASLDGREAAEIEETFARLENQRAIEREHGVGAALDLENPCVGKLMEWDQLGSVRFDNAIKFPGLKGRILATRC